MKGEIEAWSKKGSEWVLEILMAAFMNAAKYISLCAEEPICLFHKS